jgi:uncharacterized tellurite resistance protein B-like protein
MLDRIQQFLKSFDGTADDPARDDPRVAAAALLVHVANADGSFTPDERARLAAALQREFEIDSAEAGRLIEAGRRADADAVDLYTFTSVLMQRMDEAQRLSIVEAIWAIIYADDGLHELEDNLAWRISELLGISSRERIAAKRAAQRQTVEG